jgi:RNA polymerase sigma-70 factor (ECF subfamily)
MDELRRRRLVTSARLDLLEDPSAIGLSEAVADDELRLIFLCCRPELPERARVALSLKTVAGLSVGEIARAFFETEATVAQRIVRAKRTLRAGGYELALPDSAGLEMRVDAVLEVIYLLFSAGYTTADGEALFREELCFDAIRLARLVSDSAVGTPKAHALVALAAFQAMRLPGRLDAVGALIPLEQQDRGRWDRGLAELGLAYFERSIGGEVSPYHIQAAIGLHYAQSLFSGEIDWVKIVFEYDRLLLLDPSPVVALNRAVAVGRAFGANAGLEALGSALGGTWSDEYYLGHAVRGQLLLEAGRSAEAKVWLERALRYGGSGPERRLIERRLAECAAAACG